MVTKQKIISENPIYDEFLYKEAREQVFMRDCYKCVNCGSDDITVHHIKPRKFYPELTCDIDNMVTLCFKCHTKEHNSI